MPNQDHRRVSVVLKSSQFNTYLPQDAMHSADYAVARCPPVCPSHAGILSKRLNISSNYFTVG